MRIAALDRKLLREVWRTRGQIISIALVVACGVMTVVTMRSAYESLRLSLDTFYERYVFGDVFASLVRAPDRVTTSIASLPGVTAVEPRIAFDVNLDVPGLVEPVTGRLLSVPAGGPAVNRVHLVTGRPPEPGRGNEVVISNAFATANGLEVGDSLGAVINGRWERLHVVGRGMSPEFVYEIAPGQIFPDNRRFGILWMDEEALSAATAMEGAFNDLVLKLGPGASVTATIDQLDRILEPWGSTGAYAREDHISHRLITDELDQSRVSGTIIPAIFLGVAGFLLHIVLSRLVRTQREQIAVLKAFGYSGSTIAGHYFRYALVAVILGSIVGVIAGIQLGQLLLGVYEEFFQFPDLIFHLSVPLLIVAVLVSGGAASFGAISAARAALRLPPAEAMRPEAPANFRPGILERIGLGGFFTPVGRMVLRSLERQPVRAGLSALAVAFSVAILLVGLFTFDAVQYMGDLQFRLTQREDVTILFTNPRPSSVRHELSSIEGISRVETFRAVAVRLRKEHRSRELVLTGLQPDGRLRRILDTELREHHVPPDGVIISEMLATLMRITSGDTLRLEILEGRRPVRPVVVTGIVDELFGLNAYMDAGALSRMMRETPSASGAYLAIDSDRLDSVNEHLKRLPAIAGVATRSAMLENFEQQLEESLLVSMSMLIFFASVIAVGVIYNGARIALSERGRELASLRVLGFTRQEIAVMLFGEQAVVTLIGIPTGFLIGLLFAVLIVQAFASETYRIPLVIRPATYAIAAIVATAAAVFAGLLVRRRLNRLDLIGVLKTRE